MKVNYKGYDIEGTADEIKSLLDSGVKKGGVVPGDFSWEKKVKRGERGKYKPRKYKAMKWGTTRQKDRTQVWTEMEEAKLIKLREEKGLSYKDIAEKLGKTLTQVKDKIKNMRNNGKWSNWDERAKVPRKKKLVLNRTLQQYILDSKQNNVPFASIAIRANKKFGVDMTKEDIQRIYSNIK